jgi:hypothetical protein
LFVARGTPAVMLFVARTHPSLQDRVRGGARPGFEGKCSGWVLDNSFAAVPAHACNQRHGRCLINPAAGVSESESHRSSAD